MLTPEENKEIIRYLGQLKGAAVASPHQKTLAVYSVKGNEFAYLETGRQLLRISLKSNPQLSMVLRERYEEVSAGVKLNPQRWNTIVLSGQLSVAEIKALIDHSYQMALEED